MEYVTESMVASYLNAVRASRRLGALRPDQLKRMAPAVWAETKDALEAVAPMMRSKATQDASRVADMWVRLHEQTSNPSVVDVVKEVSAAIISREAGLARKISGEQPEAR